MSSEIKIIKCGITDIKVDAIVNAANEHLIQETGVCEAVFKRAGEDALANACQLIGGCPTGQAVITEGFDSLAKYIIHAVGPVYRNGRYHEKENLYSCYQKSLELAQKYDCESIAFPLISAGHFGYPIMKAWDVAITSVIDYFSEHPDYEVDVYFTVLDDSILETGNSVLEKYKPELMQEMNNLALFWRQNEKWGCFSQWFPSPFEIEGIRYETAEQYMMAKKALLFNDFNMYQLIMQEKEPKKCKEYGRLVQNFDPVLWESVCEEIVYNGNLAKFSQNYSLQEKLLKTKNKIIAEASPYDKIWGIGMKANHPNACDPRNWKGKNLLGNALMKVRKTIEDSYES